MLRDEYGRLLLDINPKSFWVVIDYLNERKITPPNSPLEMPHTGEEDDIVIQQLLVFFGIVDDSIV